ncbi:MAG: WYL domain-containing protein [Treponema sp.]|nr:WYL domain-containing protein [Treponema sp.]
MYLSFQTNQLSPTLSWVLSFAGSARVLNPPELKERIRQAATRLLNENLLEEK